MVHYVLLAGLLPVTEWNTRAAHICSVRNVAAVNVVNDGAESGVRLVTNLVDTGRSDIHFHNVL